MDAHQASARKDANTTDGCGLSATCNATRSNEPTRNTTIGSYTGKKNVRRSSELTQLCTTKSRTKYKTAFEATDPAVSLFPKTRKSRIAIIQARKTVPSGALRYTRNPWSRSACTGVCPLV